MSVFTFCHGIVILSSFTKTFFDEWTAELLCHTGIGLESRVIHFEQILQTFGIVEMLVLVEMELHQTVVYRRVLSERASGASLPLQRGRQPSLDLDAYGDDLMGTLQTWLP